jgi:hypothetical protein
VEIGGSTLFGCAQSRMAALTYQADLDCWKRVVGVCHDIGLASDGQRAKAVVLAGTLVLTAASATSFVNVRSLRAPPHRWIGYCPHEGHGGRHDTDLHRNGTPVETVKGDAVHHLPPA